MKKAPGVMQLVAELWATALTWFVDHFICILYTVTIGLIVGLFIWTSTKGISIVPEHGIRGALIEVWCGYPAEDFICERPDAWPERSPWPTREE